VIFPKSRGKISLTGCWALCAQQFCYAKLIFPLDFGKITVIKGKTDFDPSNWSEFACQTYRFRFFGGFWIIMLNIHVRFFFELKFFFALGFFCFLFQNYFWKTRKMNDISA
jgi:hypothetical protein